MIICTVDDVDTFESIHSIEIIDSIETIDSLETIDSIETIKKIGSMDMSDANDNSPLTNSWWLKETDMWTELIFETVIVDLACKH